ncbi:MAG: GGDEF domain-containing protein [Oscillospiraceae bacterium]|nr:GGDEF domain-containing protein [Oscillospiraceae bacterium]
MLRFAAEVKDTLGRLRSGSQIDEVQQYSLLLIICALIHLLSTVGFALLGVPQAAYFNAASTVLYILCHAFITGKNLHTIYYITYAEILVCTVVTVLTVGWGYGSQLYIVAITPIIFFLSFSREERNDGAREIMAVGTTSFLAYTGAYLLSAFVEPMYETPVYAALAFHTVNSLCMFSVITVFSMIFLRDQQEKQNMLENERNTLDYEAGVDKLTGLFNRRSMDSFIEEADASGESFSYIMCDIDHFKNVNDTYGHDAGDVILKGIANIIRENTRETDIVCRWGGEEILILANGSNLEAAYRLADRIRRKVERAQFVVGKDTIGITITMGVAEITECATPEELLGLADNRLYAGKHAGRNRVVYSG